METQSTQSIKSKSYFRRRFKNIIDKELIRGATGYKVTYNIFYKDNSHEYFSHPVCFSDIRDVCLEEVEYIRLFVDKFRCFYNLKELSLYIKYLNQSGVFYDILIDFEDEEYFMLKINLNSKFISEYYSQNMLMATLTVLRYLFEFHSLENNFKLIPFIYIYLNIFYSQKLTNLECLTIAHSNYWYNFSSSGHCLLMMRSYILNPASTIITKLKKTDSKFQVHSSYSKPVLYKIGKYSNFRELSYTIEKFLKQEDMIYEPTPPLKFSNIKNIPAIEYDVEIEEEEEEEEERVQNNIDMSELEVII